MVQRILAPLTPYPGGISNTAARHLPLSREKLRKQLDALREEIAATEEQFAEAFSKADTAQTARDRIAELAARRK